MIHCLHYPLHEVADYINWLYFFHAWGFPSHYGSIAQVHGCKVCRQNWLSSFPTKEQPRANEAVRLFDDARQLLNQLDSTIQTHALVGQFPAASDGDDILVQTDDAQTMRLPMLRQQHKHMDKPCLCLSDFIRPYSNGMHDHVGIFVATVDQDMEQSFADDGYHHMLAQTLADRLAEATAEKVHEIVRKQLWGYAPKESHTIGELFAERYQGKRPAVGYPSLPDQSLNFLLDEILDFKRIGVSLTQNGAMIPHASTSGLMLSHPATQHFSVGKITEEQLLDYARRRKLSVQQAHQFLAANTL